MAVIKYMFAYLETNNIIELKRKNQNPIYLFFNIIIFQKNNRENKKFNINVT